MKFFTHNEGGYYYVAVLGEGIKIYDLNRTELFYLWWSVFKEWIVGGA